MKQILHTVTRHKKVITVALTTALVILLLLFLSRAWLRTSGVTWYANTFLQPTIHRRFEDNIGYVNKQLALLGVKVNAPGPVPDGCEGSQYEGIHISLSCSKSATSGKVYDSEQFVKNWQQKTQAFENDLFSKGWKQDNTDQDITQLLDPASYQPEIVYSLDMGKVYCSVRIGYNKYDTANRRVFVDEFCYRSVEIFGGY